ncbi:carbohydrate kinase [Pullulanibacillus sp. KACC 23026]|uniref:carbohydrate kinase family protein n=1 Tax=Pullulanibacillus sp. KACC 23026 TaxID=3028315 RepID=UPI0023B0A177|nr:carbohydrate kinase [Pullulanibacillus sp. KACC 23026]WEG12165.1 carbohydrate kinase [Pullulanibacillus sp. KACC 23026]
MAKSVLCVGELLIDFFCTDIESDLIDGHHFFKSAGGAPANVTAAISRLGGTALFSGKVGSDPFGFFLKQTLDDVGVDTSLLVMDKAVPTTLAFVSLKSNGDRDFVFNRGADAHLKLDEIDTKKVEASFILHFGSATAMLSDPFCTTYFQMMEDAHKRGQFLSFDPNYRADLWKENAETFIKLSKRAIALSDFVKVSDEELALITGIERVEEGVRALHKLGAKAVAVTLGKEGTFVSLGSQSTTVPSIPIQSVDSTGAGDAFVGAALFKLAQSEDPRTILTDFEELQKVIVFSNKVGAIVCTKIGAIVSLPSLEEVEQW